MKRFSEQLKKKADHVRLSASERADLRERLVAYMEYHPLPEAQPKRRATESMATEPFKSVSLRSVYLKGAFGFLALFLIVGVPLIAERSLPGDVLYPVKISFNEELRSSLTLSPYEKVEWETERLGRRIAEARLLASEGKLTQEYEEEVAQAVKEHSDAAKREIETLRETDAEEAAIAEIAFSSALEVQSAVLKSERANSSSTNAIAGAVEAERSEAEEKETASEAVPSVERLTARIEQETTRAYELLESIREYATAQEIGDIERRLEDIERKIQTAMTQREAEETDEQEVRRLLREALKGTQKLIVFMTDIDVRETVVISDLIPVELTDEERVAVIKEVLAEIDSGVEAAEAELASTTDDAILEKVEAGLVSVREQYTVATTSLAAGELDAAEAAATDAFNLIRDVAGLLQIDPVTPTDPAEEDPTATTTDPVVEGEEDPAATSTDTGGETETSEDDGTGTSTDNTTATTTSTSTEGTASTTETE